MLAITLKILSWRQTVLLDFKNLLKIFFYVQKKLVTI